MGTTGESPTVSFEEHVRVIRLAVEFAEGKVKVIAGTGANSTDEAIYLTKAPKRLALMAPSRSRRIIINLRRKDSFSIFGAIAKATKTAHRAL